MARIVEFFDGAQSETTPTIGNIVASSLVRYTDDADYEANEQGSPFEGNIYFNETLNLIRYYNGAEWISLVDESSAQTLTSKSMDGDLNTFTDIDLPSLKTQLADANKFIVRNAPGQVISLKTVPVGEVVGTSDTQTLTNKTIDADVNTITNIDNADIKASAAIDTTKFADGTVSNTEFQYINSLTSNAQDQLDSKIPLSQKGAPNGVAELDGTGKVPSVQLPSYVDDVLEYANLAAFPVTGETAKIYVAIDNGKTYRWTGSIYTEISTSDVNSVNGYTGIVNLALDDISNVNAPTPSIGDLLTFNGTNWVNQAGGTVSDLDDLSDVVITTPAAGQKLQYNGTNWVNVTDNLDSLSDTTITAPATGEKLQYNGTQWVNVTDNLNNLTDVDTTGVATRDVLQYNGTNWVPRKQTLVRAVCTTSPTATASPATIIYNNETFDTLGEYNNTTGIFTASKATTLRAYGRFSDTGAVALTTSQSITISVLFNGSPVQTKRLFGNGNNVIHSVEVEDIITVAPGDNIRFQMSASVSVTLNNAGNENMMHIVEV